MSKLRIIKTIESELPDFAKMVKTTAGETIMLHQTAFAADGEEKELSLLGMAIKYAGIYGREVIIVPEESFHVTIECPFCKGETEIGHFHWSSLQCQNCGKMVDKESWKIKKVL